MDLAKTSEKILAVLLLFFAGSFLLLLGSDQSTQVVSRSILAGITLLLALPYLRLHLKSVFLNPAALCFAVFLGFELVRSIWGLAQHQTLLVWAFLRWGSYFSFFLLAYAYFNSRTKVNRLFETLAWTGSFIALNVIPSLFKHPGRAYYTLTDGADVAFLPLFHFHPAIGKYFLGSFAHPNYSGDVLAIGFFAALSLGLYAVFQFAEKNNDVKEPGQYLTYSLLRLAMALLIATAIFLFFARGTMLTFLMALSVYFGLLLIKFPSKYMTGAVIVSGLLIFGFLAWGGNLKSAWKEIRTLETEQKAFQREALKSHEVGKMSVDAVREGIRRSLAIYRANPVWGVGTGGYKKVSMRYADPEKGLTGGFMNLQSLCHYTQMMAEEGIGAFFYFIFLLAYAIQLSFKLFRTRSRFKFMMALSLGALLSMIFIHAAFNQLLEQFAMGMPVHFLMGAALGILRQDFNHESK